VEQVKKGRFREDLYYRLSGFTISLPPLRERGEDLPLLVLHYLRRFAKEMDRPIEGIAPPALDVLKTYSWPGNVRELQNILKQALLQASGTVLLPDFLPRSVYESDARPSAAERGQQDSLNDLIDQKLRQPAENLYEDCLRWMERILITKVLQ